MGYCSDLTGVPTDKLAEELFFRISRQQSRKLFEEALKKALAENKTVYKYKYLTDKVVISSNIPIIT